MPSKDKIQKTFFVTPAQDVFLKQAVKKGDLSEYIRKLIVADLPGFPDDMSSHGDIERIPAEKLRRKNK